MRVLMVCERFPPQRGGVAVSAGRLARNLAPRLDMLGVVQLSSDLAPGLVAESRWEGARVFRVGRPAEEDEALRLLELVIASLVRVEGFQLLHGFYAVPAGYVACLAGRLCQVPCCVSLRGNDLDRQLYRRGQSAWLERCLAMAARLSCVSREQQTRLARLHGRDDAVFVANAVDPQEFFPVGPSERGVLVVSGETRFKKGLDLLLQLLEEWDGRSDRTLVLLGGVRREEQGRLEAWRTSQPGAASRLELLAYRRDLAWLRQAYARAELVLVPSLWEGMPNAMLEAMACRRPVLASAVGGALDVIAEGRTGYLLAPEELGQLGQRVEEILKQDSQAVAEAGYQAVLKGHSPAIEAQAFLELYEGMLPGGTE